MEKLRLFLKNNKDYIAGILFVTFTSLFAMLIFFNKSLTLQEGWYSIYANNILNLGLIPYRDFNFLVPPLSLYVWTLIQYIFGDNFIVFHIADIFSKLAVGICFYHILTRFFSARVSALCAFCSQIIIISAIFDNGVLSYNEYWVILMFLMIILMLAQLKFIEEKSEINYKLAVALGIVFALSLLTKQSSGPVNVFAATVLTLFAVYKKFGLKSIIKPFLVMFLSSLAFFFAAFGYFIINNALPSFITNVFMSYGAKGSMDSMLIKVFVLLFNYNLIWPVFAALCVFFIFYILGKELKVDSGNIDSENKNTVKTTALAALLFIITVFSSFIYVKYYLGPANYVSFENAMKQFSAIGAFFIFFIALYSAVEAAVSKTWQYKNLKFLTVTGMFLSAVFIHSLSNGFPNVYPYLLAFVFACALGIKTLLNKTKNFAVYSLIFAFCFMGVSMKLQSPAVFHGWRCGNITGKLEYSYIPKLKGIKLPVEEKNMYEDIYTKVHKYTNTDDAILAFNNNQVFYELLERKPYTKYISLYYDVSPDYQSLEVLDKLKSDPPKAIVFFKFSEASEDFHEEIFRDGYKSGQRTLGQYLGRLTDNGEYVVAADYKPEKMIEKNKLSEDLYPDYDKYLAAQLEYAQLGDALKNTATGEAAIIQDKLKSLRNEIKRLQKKMKKARYDKNAFLRDDFELKLLIRSDVYKEINEEIDKK